MSLHGFGDSKIFMAMVSENVYLTKQLFESWNNHPYDFFRWQKNHMRRLGFSEALPRISSWWMSPSIRYAIKTSTRVEEYDKMYHSSYTSLLYQVVDGNSEPKKFFSQKIPLTHGLIVIEDGREEQGLLVSGHFKFLNGLKNIPWSQFGLALSISGFPF